jgi:choline kinase
MTGIILAAGRGDRLLPIAARVPKCLLRIGDCTLLARQIRALQVSGVDRIVVVVGYRAEQIREAVGPDVVLVHNERFASTNSVYSFWLARRWFADGAVVLNSDVLFHERALVDLLAAREDDALLVERRTGDYTDEQMKVRIERGCVVDIAKTLPVESADGESLGIARFGRDGAHALLDDVDRLLASGGSREWLPAAFRLFCQRRPLRAVDTRGYPWIEIDFPEDYRRACGDVLQAVEAMDRSAPLARRQADAGASRRAGCHV